MRHGTAFTVAIACLTPRHALGWATRIPAASTWFKAEATGCQRRHAQANTLTSTSATPRKFSSSSPFRRTTKRDNTEGPVAVSTRLEAATTPRSSPWSASADAGVSVSPSPLALGGATVALVPGAKRGNTERTAPSFDGDRKEIEPSVARLILAMVACLYGTNYATVKVMEGVLEPSNLLALRFGLASLAFLPALSGASFEVLLAGAEIGVYAILAYASQAWALRMLPTSELALTGSLAVLVVPLFDHISGRRRACPATILAAILACGGAAVLQAAGGVTGDDGGATMWDHALSLLQPIFFGLSTWRMEAHATRYPGQAPALTAGQVMMAAVASALWSIVAGDCSSRVPEAFAHPLSDPGALAITLWLGLVTTALVMFLETKSLESVSATEATVIYSLDPLVGTGIASTVLGEPFGPGTALGASLVLGGCMCSCLGHANEDETTSAGARDGDREGGT